MIVIPTYKRYNIKTITLLEKEGFTPDEITIYVANQEEYDIYVKNYPKYNIIIGVITIKAQREFIQSQYPEGTILISMDDDIEDYKHKDKNLRQIFNECVEYLSQSSTGLLSFNPSSNPYFSLKDWKFKEGRYLCVGFVHIFKVDHSIIGDIDCVEDYDRTMMYIKKYGFIIRYGQVCFKTKYCSDGGLSEYRTRDVYLECVNKLLLKYPNDLYFNIQKSGYLKGLPNVKLRRKSQNICFQ
jgi:hypothetical protein